MTPNPTISAAVGASFSHPRCEQCHTVRAENFAPTSMHGKTVRAGELRPYVDAWQTAVLLAPVTHSWKQHLAQPATCLARVYSPPPRTHQQITPDCNHFFTLF